MSGYSVTLEGQPPWGFRLQGGKDFNMPLTVSRVTAGSKSAQANMSSGDVVTAIDGVSTAGMTHLEAQNKIKASIGNLKLGLQRGKRPAPVPTATPIIESAPIVVPHQKVRTHTRTHARIHTHRHTHTHTHAYTHTHTDTRVSVHTHAYTHTHTHTQTRACTRTNTHARIHTHRHAHTDTHMSVHTHADTHAYTRTHTHTHTKVYNSPAGLYAGEAAEGQRRGTWEEKQDGGPPKEVVVDTSTPVFQAVARREATARGDGPSTADEDWANKNSTAQSRSFKILAQITGTHDAGEGGVPLRRTCLCNERNCPPPPHNSACTRAPQKATALPPAQRSTGRANPGPTTPAAATRTIVNRRGTRGRATFPSTGPGPPTTATPPAPSASSLSAWGAAAPPSYSFSLSLGAKPSVAYPFSHAASAASPPSRSSTPAPPSPPAAVPPPPPPPPLLFPGDGASLAPRSLVGTAPQCPPSSSFSAATQPRSLASSNSPVSGLLVQRAEHVPEALRAPFCNKCNNIIRGPFIVALGRSWHKDHFNCCHCNSCLADTGFVVEAGKVYCQGCYGMFFAPPCGKCSQKIVGEITYALKQAWHSNCFVCACCSQPIGQGVFHMEDGDPYCEKDFFRLFSTKCEGCDFPVEAGDRYVEALGHTWHDTCFVCTVCQVNLEGQPFYSKKNKPLCKKHANSINI
ncbi:unnamed protein product [Lampetra planeri]